MRVHITARSSNVKTGPIPVTTTERKSCPTTCPFWDKGCYAKSGPLALHWRKVSDGERGTDWQGLCDFVSSLPAKQLWRHNQAGDMPHHKGSLIVSHVFDLVAANYGKRGFTYTHHVLNPHNLRLIDYANDNGFTINVSKESITDAVKAHRSGLPAVAVVPSDADVPRSYEGVTVTECPAQVRNTTCSECGLCAQAERQCVVVFRAHGNAKRHVSDITSAA